MAKLFVCLFLVFFSSNDVVAGTVQKTICGTGWPTSSGYVVTNYHVVHDNKDVLLIRQDGVEIPATVAVRDRANDLALLRPTNLDKLPPALPLATVPVGAGASVFTIGYPYPDIMGVKSRLTDGVVSAIFGVRDDPRYLQISVPLHPGNSGGPLLNMNGEIVGVVTSKLSALVMLKVTGDLPENVSYALKIPYVKVLLESVSALVSHGVLPVKKGTMEVLAKRISNSVLMVVAKTGQQQIASLPSERYSKASGIIYDQHTGLEWYVGPDIDTTWKEGCNWVENLTVQGGGWRMPTLAELKTLYQEGVGTRNLHPIFRTTGLMIYSGEKRDCGPRGQWCTVGYFRFDMGYESYVSEQTRKVTFSGFRVFAVRFRR